MKLRRLLLPFWILIFFGCASDDSNMNMVSETDLSVADFIVIGEDLENVYQYDFNGDLGTGELENLTQQSGITLDYLTLREIQGLLSFYYFRNGSFTVRLKDTETGETVNYVDFFDVVPEQSIAWGINNESSVFFSFFGPSGSRNLGVQDVTFQGDLGQTVNVDFNIDIVSQPLLYENKVYFVYKDNQQNNKLSFYDITSKTRGPILNFNSESISFLIAESGNVAVIKNGSNATLEIYDSSSMTFLEKFQLQFNSGFDPGPINGAVFSDNKLFYSFPYAQPSKFPFGPAIFDFSTQENILLDLFSILEDVEQEQGAGVALTSLIYSMEKDLFFIGYGVLGDNPNGGILQISNSGELVANVTIPFFPTHIVQN